MNLSKVAAGIVLLILALPFLGDAGTMGCALPLILISIYLFLTATRKEATDSQQPPRQPSNSRRGPSNRSPGTRSSKRAPSVTITVQHTSRESQFVEQARRYVNRRGKPASHVHFKTYWPTYGDMTAPQQAWYFFWREEVRNGRYLDTSLSYIFLHIYELLNNVGVASTKDGYDQLRRLWLNYRERYPQLDGYLSAWVTDYLTFNPGELKPLNLFADPELQPALVKRSPDLVLHTFLQDERPLRTLPLYLLDALTDYRVQHSKFYRSGYDRVIVTAIGQVLEAVDTHLRHMDGQGIFAQYQPKTREKITGGTFQSAIYDGPTKTVTVARVYTYSNHKPFRQFLTAVVKHTENLLRQRHSFPGRLKVPPLKRKVAAVIEQTVTSRPVATPEATEFEVAEPGGTGRADASVPIPPPIQVSATSPGELRVISKQYLTEARKFAALKARTGALVPLESPFTSYSYDYTALTRKQARWYFYWRNQVRQGNYPPTDLAYIFILAPELIHLIGVGGPGEAYRHLRAVWLNYREEHPAIEPYLLAWMLSFAMIYDCSVAPRDILLEPAAHDFAIGAAPDVLLTRYQDGHLRGLPLDLLDQLVDHNIRRSSFYTAGHEDLMQRVVPAVIDVVNKQHAGSSNGSLFEQFKPHPLVVEVKRCWRATQTYANWPTRIVFPDVPAYSQNEKFRRLLTGIVKHTENRLREEKEHRGRLRVSGLDSQTEALIDRLIDRNRDAITPPSTTPPLEVDLSRVEMLRMESEEVLGMLQTAEVDDGESSDIPPGLSPETESEPPEVTDAEISEPVLSAPSFGEEDEIWAEMAAVLDEHQVDALAAIIEGNSVAETIHRIATEQFVMPTMLIDSINELAQDVIGDILIEMEPAPQLIDDYYKPMVEEIIEKRRSL